MLNIVLESLRKKNKNYVAKQLLGFKYFKKDDTQIIKVQQRNFEFKINNRNVEILNNIIYFS